MEMLWITVEMALLWTDGISEDSEAAKANISEKEKILLHKEQKSNKILLWEV